MATTYLSIWRGLLFLTIFASLATSCMSAFNDFKYNDNATFFEEAVAQCEADPAMGWANVLGSTSPLQPWPQNNSGLVNIQYCWPDLETKLKLENAIQGGWAM